MAHDYERHGSTTPFTVLDALENTVIGRQQPARKQCEWKTVTDYNHALRSTLSRWVHSRYRRRVADLPVSERNVHVLRRGEGAARNLDTKPKVRE